MNGGWLLVLSLLIISGGAERLVSGVHQVHGLPVLVASAIAAATMAVGVVILGGDVDDLDYRDGDAMNVRAVLLDTAADAATAAGVAVTGAIIFATGGLYWLDPLVAMLISIVVACHAMKLLGRVALTLRRNLVADSPTP